MPNWVFTTMTVSGPEQSLGDFRAKAAKPYTTRHKGVFTEGKGYDPDAVNVAENKSDLSFWNFIEPDDKNAYFGEEVKPEGYDAMTLDERMEHAMRFSGDNWYDWNVRNWGTKWDACDACCGSGHEGDTLVYNFSTAWSPAEGAFRAMVIQHKDLKFEFYCEEEQGWGVVYEGEDGEIKETRSWDVPNSHQDFVDMGKECDRCTWDHLDLYDDCPRGETPGGQEDESGRAL